MTQNAYKQALAKLNTAQRAAVETIEGPVVVVAGPGTGKTHVLTTRIAHILHETDSTPDSILALTFTEAGASAMQLRLYELIGKDAYKTQIATFHGFANQIIQEFPEYFPRIIGARQVDSLERLELIEKILTEGNFELLKPFGNELFYVKSISQVIQDIKREGYDPHKFENLIKEQSKDFGSIEDLYHSKGKNEGEMKGKYKVLERKIEKNFELLQVFREYERIKQEQKLFDYEDTILELLYALENEDDLLSALQERYLYILADEHQDSNRAQNKILDHISSFHENPNIFIVGDDKQAIYRFQGASLENFQYFFKPAPRSDYN
ncbi:MAG: UvrD-helicase domain-containing protein [Candidatus Campbellbacteria bacterium]|nr:UvrD-helicase domain-containing protein [Candidatus Campbellbacteria bacterium]